MKRKSVIILVLAVLVFQEIKAQSNYVDGYVLTSEIDTLYGKIDNKDYYNNSQFCDFKGVNTDSVIRYYPDKIYGYRFTNGKYYVSKNIEINKKQIRLFMEYLVHGKLDVYFFQDKDHANHYFASKDTLPLNELKYSKEIINDEGKLMLHESKSYIGLLTYLTYDCQAIKNEIPNLNEPDHQKLINFAERYHNLTCKDEKCIIYEKKIHRKIKLNISGGSTFMFSNKLDVKQNVYPSYGFNVLFQQTQRSEGVYIGIGLYQAMWIKGVFLRGYQIPLSVSYSKPKMGFSPIISYDFDLNLVFIVQALKLGLNYQMKNMSFVLTADLKTVFIIKPLGSSLNFGLCFDLR